MATLDLSIETFPAQIVECFLVVSVHLPTNLHQYSFSPVNCGLVAHPLCHARCPQIPRGISRRVDVRFPADLGPVSEVIGD